MNLSVLVDVDPTIIGQHHGLGGEDIAEIVLHPRIVRSIVPRLEAPLDVYVYRVIDRQVMVDMKISQSEQIAMIAWATIYKHQHDAIAAFERTRGT